MRVDHVLHFLACWILADFLGLFVGPDVAFLIVIIVAAMKEAVWDGFMDRGDPDAIDFLAGVTGAALALLWWSGPLLFSLWVFWNAFVYTQGLYRAFLAGRLKGLPLLMAAPVVALAFVLDFLFQMTVFNVLFWEFPRHWLVTYRLRDHIKTGKGWRYRLADYICKHMLDPFDPTGAHCDSEPPSLKA